LERALKGGYDIVYDSQLTNFPLADDTIQRILARNGSITIDYTHADYIASWVGATIHNETPGEEKRVVTPEAVAKGWNNSLPTFIELFKKYRDNLKVKMYLPTTTGTGNPPYLSSKRSKRPHHFQPGVV
jgi:hypothetical protein